MTFKCEECDNEEFSLYKKEFTDLVVNGAGQIISSEHSYWADELSEMMECTECGMEYPTDELNI